MSPPEEEIETIEKSYSNHDDKKNGHLPLLERYYLAKYCIDVVQNCDDYCVLVHTNRVCLVTLAKSHYVLVKCATDGLKVEKVDFRMSGDGVDRLSNAVSGKRKRGAQKLVVGSPLVEIHLSDGSRHTLNAPIAGKLLEVNRQLLTRPELITTHPGDLGYLAIVLPEITRTDHYKRSLFSVTEYQELISKRSTPLLQ